MPFAPSPGLYFLIHSDLMAHPDTQIIPRFACSLENRGPVGLSQRTHIHHCNNVVGIPDILAPPEKNPKTFPRALPQQPSVSLRCGGKSRWFGFDVADYFSSSPTLEIDTLSHIPQRGVPVGLAVEYSRRHLSARADTITLSLHHLFFFFFLFTYVFH